MENEEFDDPNDMVAIFGFDKMIKEQEAKDQEYAINDTLMSTTSTRKGNTNDKSEVAA